MIYVNLPIGSNHGWGAVGKYLARELSRLEPVRLICDSFNPESINDPLDYADLSRLIPTPEESARVKIANGLRRFDGPLIQDVANKMLVPTTAGISGTTKFGYTFFEENIIDPQWIENGRRCFHRIITGSSWCTRVLSDNGLANVATAVQGVDPTIFHSAAGEGGEHDYFRDKFIVFSGGKFELRKGQDIVIRAYKVIQDRHRDVMLINAWQNLWPAVMRTMQASPVMRYDPRTPASVAGINQVLATNGIDVSRAITLPMMQNLAMARIYRNTDVGVFPNRCEGGTNLVLMEYMACGKPAIATDTTGHGDIVTPTNALVIKIRGEFTVCDAAIPIARWPEPDLDDTIEKLEWAYQNRDKLREIGRRAAADMADRTWRHTAAIFQRIIRQTPAMQ